MNDQYTLCRCGKVRFTSWRAALRNARGIMRQRKASRGMTPYYSRECRCTHVGMATSKKRKRMTGKALAA